MKWRVVYLDASGTQTECVMDAESRAALFKALSEQGISPSRVDEVKGDARQRAPHARPRSVRKVRLAYVLPAVAVLLALALFLFMRNGNTHKAVDTEKRESRQIKTVANPVKKVPAPAEPAVEEPPKPIDPNARPTKVGEIVNNYIKLPSGKIHYIRGEVTNNVAASAPKEWFEVFDNRCENEIALYLTMEPGETLVGTPVYRGRFVKEFLKSLETPIVASPDDSQEVKDLKRAVTETKIELKAAYDRGEDIEQIMLDTRSQLQDLSAYKHALETDMKAMVRDKAESYEDIDDFIAAANHLLAEKGIAPMKLNPIARKRLERMVEQKRNSNE